MKRIRIFALAAALLMTCALLGGCTKKPISTDTVLMNVGGRDVSMEEYRYYYLSIKSQYDSGTSSYWNNNKDGRAELKKSTLDYLLQNAACDQLLADNGYTVTAEDTAAVDTYLSGLKSYYGSEQAYQQALKDNNLTEAIYRQSLERSQMAYRYLYDTNKANNAEQFNDTLSKYVRVKHVLVKCADSSASSSASSSESSTTRTEAEALALAQDIAAQARGGADFDALVEKYGEDPGMVNNTDGYYFTTGKMMQAFEDTSFALQEGEISDPVKTTAGYHVIVRLPMEEKYLRENFADIFTDDIFFDAFDASITDLQGKLEVTYTKAYDQIDIETVQ